MLDVAKIRADIYNYGDKIFLNSAGASLMPHSVVQAITHWLSLEESHGGYAVSDRNINLTDEFYVQAGRLLNVSDKNIAFAHDATDAFTKALSSFDFKKGDLIITSKDDYASNQIQYISLMNRLGVEIQYIRNHVNGDLDIDHFNELIQKRHPSLVAISHIPTNSGLIQNVKSIGEICDQREIIFLLDACQSVGQIDVDVQAIKCDFLTATGRKFLRGPRGTGFLYVSDRILDQKRQPLFIDGYGATWTDIDTYDVRLSARRFETWERPVAMQVGLIEALKYLQDIGLEHVNNHNRVLMKRLRTLLQSIPGVQVYDKGSRQCNILTFRKNGVDLTTTQQWLDQHHVYYSVSEAHWGLLDFREKGVDWVIRLSPHYFNTTIEMDQIAQIIEEM